jgi:hypothetical protein
MNIRPAKFTEIRLKSHLGLFSLLLAITVIVYILASLGANYRSPSSKLIERIWQQDISNLNNLHKLPSTWSEIRLVEKVNASGDSSAEVWARDTNSPIEINPKGEYKLEVLFISQHDGKHERVVIQHHMIHIPSGNSVWELGRTYELN